MGVPLNNWLYFFGDGKGKTARMVSGVAKMLGGKPVPIKNLPANWRELEVGFATDKKYRSLNRTATLELNFVGDGADILRYYMYRGKGFQENIYAIILQKSEITGKYELEYSGLLDMPKAIDTPQIGVKVQAKQGGPVAAIAANESVVYSINSTATNANTTKTLFDGMTFREKYHYVYGIDNAGSDFDLSNDFNNTFPLVFGSNEGYAFDVVRNDSILPEAFSVTDIAAYMQGANYIFYRPYATQITTGGKIVWCRSSGPGAYHVDVYFYTSLGNRYNVIVNHELNGDFTNPETLNIPALNINLAPNEKLFLVVTRYEGGGLFTAAIFSGTDVTFELNTINQPTTALGFRPLPLWQELVSRISNGKYTGASNYFTANTEITLFSGQSLRNLVNAILQISFEQFYDFYDSLRPMGLRIIGDVVYIEPFEDLYGDGPALFSFGEVSKVSVSFAFDTIPNTLKMGYPGLNVQELNGVPEYNGTNIYSLPIDTLKQEYMRVSQVICAASEIEKTRSLPTTLNNSNTPSDTSLFGANVSTTQDVDGNFILTRKTYTSISGVVDATAYNIEGLTPGRMVRAAGVVLSPVLEQQGAVSINFESSDRSGALITVEPGLTIAERNPIPKGALAPGFYHCLDLNFLAPMPAGYAAQFSDLDKGIIDVNYLDTVVKVLPIGEMNAKPGTQEPQQAKLRISNLTPLSVLQSLSLQGTFSVDALNNTIFISDLNPIHLSKSGANNNRFKGVYDAQFQDRQTPYDHVTTFPAYLQKWVKARTIPFQFVTSGYGLLTLKVRIDGQPTAITQVCTLVADAAVRLPYIMQQTTFDLSAFADSRIIFGVFDGATELFVSEWIDLSTTQDACHEIFYYHSTNIFNTYWDNFRPSIFVEMNILPLQPQVEGTEYIDELHDNATLNGRTWDLRTAQFGARSPLPNVTSGLPDWMVRKLNIITVLSYWATDGYAWAKAKATDSLTPLFPTNLPLNVYTLNINPAKAVTGLIYTGTPEPLTDSFAATMDASSFGIDGGGVIDIDVPA